MLSNCGAGEDSWESLDSKQIQPVYPKGYQPWIPLEGLMLKLKLQYFGHLMQRADSLEKTPMLGKIEGRRRRGQQRMRCHHQINGHEFEQTLRGSEGQESLVCCSPWRYIYIYIYLYINISETSTKSSCCLLSTGSGTRPRASPSSASHQLCYLWEVSLSLFLSSFTCK